MVGQKRSQSDGLDIAIFRFPEPCKDRGMTFKTPVFYRLLQFVVLQCAFCLGVAAAADRPNIVYLMADDLGHGDFSAERMPRSYELRQQSGTELKFYTMQNCATSRAALMTGKYPSEMGVVGVNSPAYYDGVPVDEILISERLQEAGYRTAIFGKWHLGLEEEQSPLNNGFDEFMGFSHGWINYYGIQSTGLPYPDGSEGHDHHGAHDFQINGIPLYNSSYSTYAFSQASQHFIRKQAAKEVETSDDQPFFLYVPFNAPHGPYASPRRYAEELMADFGISQSELDLLYEYEDEVLSLPYDHEIDDDTFLRLQHLLYYGSVRALDDAIADIYKALEETGEAENTLFMFTSDNGASFGSRGLPGDNGIFKGGKGSPYEGGHRVPNLLIWPAQIPVNHSVGFNVWIGDLYETFLAAAGVSFNDSELASNNVLEPLLAGDQAFTRKHGGQHIISHISKITINDQDTAIFALNNAHQKYIRTTKINPTNSEIISIEEELYDLDRDPSEKTDVSLSPVYQAALNRMRFKFRQFGGNERMVSMPTTRRSGWNEFTLPQEWGFPGREFEADELLYSDIF